MQHERVLLFQLWFQPRSNSLFVGGVLSFIKTWIRLWDRGFDFLKPSIQTCPQRIRESRMLHGYIGRFTQIIQDVV